MTASPPTRWACDDEAEIKAALHARLRREGTPGSPADIETAYQALRRGREVRENLESLRQAGATVEYAQADVRDPAALARVLDGWRARHGEIVGLIHGAGLIKDKLIRQKSVESFDRVLETKLDGALNLIRLRARRRSQVHGALFLDRRAASAMWANPIMRPPTKSSTSWPTGWTAAGRAASCRSSGALGRAWAWCRSSRVIWAAAASA